MTSAQLGDPQYACFIDVVRDPRTASENFIGLLYLLLSYFLRRDDIGFVFYGR